MTYDIPATDEWADLTRCTKPDCDEQRVEYEAEGRPGRPPTRCIKHYEPQANARMSRLYRTPLYALTGRNHFRGTVEQRQILRDYRDYVLECEHCGETTALEIDHDHSCERHVERDYCLGCVRGILCKSCNSRDVWAGEPLDGTNFQLYLEARRDAAVYRVLRQYLGV